MIVAAALLALVQPISAHQSVRPELVFTDVPRTSVRPELVEGLPFLTAAKGQDSASTSPARTELNGAAGRLLRLPDEAIAYVNSGPPPLGLYVFATDTSVVDHILNRTTSGGLCVNACTIQGAIPSLGFGGAGHSGYGRHRGVEGFREFSHQRAVVTRGEGDLIHAFFPPYSGLARSVVAAALDTPPSDADTSKEN